ncbi:molecular chaperone GrpE [Skermanella stibiiresistens SB22]|uniref:Protein GrpE n=1 Tax=Skermanella stibiiresistens SB22 TaxID=1385369 RepID=W9H9M6_9PROT|nr:nucleotide exchange factor GrpE [Skermanella stibiiresistens]EWY40543.1 molecular chaperone GrpE [Skermanella stibiiresistens SB22]
MNDPQKKPTEAEPEATQADAGPDAKGHEHDAAQASGEPASNGSEGQDGSRKDDRAAALEAEVASLKDQLLRNLAETENMRRRAQREREDTAKYAVSSFAKELVAVADNLRRAVEAVTPEQREQDEALKNLLTGVEATERQLQAAFDRAGIKRMEALGEQFDPNFHQVVFEVENTGKPGGTIVQVLQEGYTIHGRLLREAMVGAAKRGADEPVSRVDTSA